MTYGQEPGPSGLSGADWAVPDREGGVHRGEGPVTAWEELCGGGEPAGAGIPLPGGKGGAPRTTGTTAPCWTGRRAALTWRSKIWCTAFTAGICPIR